MRPPKFLPTVNEEEPSAQQDDRIPEAYADNDAAAAAYRLSVQVGNPFSERKLLLHNALRVDEACAADIADLGEDCGHRVLRVVRKGARKAKIPLTPATVVALEAYLADRAQRAGLADWRQPTGPVLATATGGRLRQGHLWDLVRRLARTAGIGGWEQLSPHSLRHSAITFALDAGASLRDVQDYAGHKDPRTTRRYDNSPATAWTATPPTLSLPTWRDSDCRPDMPEAAPLVAWCHAHCSIGIQFDPGRLTGVSQNYPFTALDRTGLRRLIWKLGPVGHGFNPGAVRGSGRGLGWAVRREIRRGCRGMGGGSAGLRFGRGQARSGYFGVGRAAGCRAVGCRAAGTVGCRAAG